MKLKFLAHAAFLLTSDRDTKILIDPYEPGGFDGAINYQPINESVDAIVISHQHADHNYIAPHHQNATVFDQVGEFEFNDIKILGFHSYHDDEKGKKRGENIIFVIKIDDVTICHLGDLGHKLSVADAELIGEIDILLVPVGGVYTIDAETATEVMHTLKPKVCIPMHYKSDKITIDLAPVNDFLADKNNVKMLQQAEIELEYNNLPHEPEIWVLEQAKA
ncbi:MAG: MBL fold metallo-hydrolase [Gammaproteobacteria bacterium]|jgi:L-ascorbate metabolism protein UlaG (beta-lactamase superfamily)